MARLSQLAAQFDLELHGDDRDVVGVCTLSDGRADAVAFLANPQYASQLPDTKAGAVILKSGDLEQCQTSALVASDPYLAYARIAGVLIPDAPTATGTHPAAVIDSQAVIGDGHSVAAGAVIGADVSIGANARIGANAVIESGVRIGDDAIIGPGVVIYAGVQIGDRVRIHANAVVGSRGFGLAPSAEGWVDVPQVGSVVVGNDVEIGASTTIDRGAIGNTELHDGVKLDNQIQIAHNCVIGRGTAIAGSTGIAGSTRIGAGCMVGGACSISGHLTIGDRVVITGNSMVTRNIDGPAMMSSGWPVSTNGEWRKQVARLRQIDKLFRRVSQLERAIKKD